MRDEKSEKWLKQAVLKKDCEPLTPSFKVRILIPLPLPRNIRVPRLFYARILLFTAVFGHFFFALKSCKSFWEILRDSKFQNSKVILLRFRAFMTETFERHRLNQNRNTNWNEQKIWETFQEKRGLKVIKLYALTLSSPFYIVYPSKMQR